MKQVQKMKTLIRSKGFEFYERPLEVNIIGVRSPFTVANRFDDEIHVLFKTDTGKWEYRVFKATTDPGTYWLNNPMSPQGTAILQQGQYKNTYALGLHRGKYMALVQALGEVSVLRDYNRDAVLDFSSATPDRGFFGINIHRAQVSGKTKFIDRHSAGCQVFEDAADFETFIKLCLQHRERYGNRFTYTLIDLRELARAGRRRAIKTVAAGTAVGALLTGIGFGIRFLVRRFRKKKAKR